MQQCLQSNFSPLHRAALKVSAWNMHNAHKSAVGWTGRKDGTASGSPASSHFCLSLRTPASSALHARIAQFVATLFDCVLDLIAMRATWTPAHQQRIAQKRRADCGAAMRGMRRAMASPRALLDGALRRTLKAKTSKGRAAALLGVLKNRDMWVAYLVDLIARGQTRIYSAHSRFAKALPLYRPAGGPPPQIEFGPELRGGLASP